MVASWITPKARKGVASDVAGQGLHAVEPIAASEVVAVKGGHIVTTQALLELPDPLRNSEIQITDVLHLVALTEAEYPAVMLYINHSCEPTSDSPAISCSPPCAMFAGARSSPPITPCSTTTTRR